MKSIIFTVCACLAGWSFALPSAAQDAFSASEEPDTSTRTAFLAMPADTAALDAMRGGAAVAYNDMALQGITSNNTAHNVISGTNSISSGAFANMSGLPTVIQNSGANVLIQNATIVHLELN